MGSWDAAYRQALLLRWIPNIYNLQRWHTDPRGHPRVFQGEDHYYRMIVATRSIIALSNEGYLRSIIPWRDEIAIALLTLKFVALTEKELNWCESGGKRSIKECIANMGRWKASWSGRPGIWIRQWTNYDREMDRADFHPNGTASQQSRTGQLQNPVPELTNQEWTLRFILAIYECIFRSEIKTTAERKEQLHIVLEAVRDEANGSLNWFPILLRKCMDERAINKTVGPEQGQMV